MLHLPAVACALPLIVSCTGGLLKKPRNCCTPRCFAANKNQFCALINPLFWTVFLFTSAARCQSSVMVLLSICSALPAPILYRHMLRPIPLGLPFDNVSMLNNQSAMAFFFSSGQLPT